MEEENGMENRTETQNWRGTSLNDLCKGKGRWSFAVTPLVPCKYHWVLHDLPVSLNSPPRPHKSKDAFLWDNDHVRMPYSDKNLFCVQENNSDLIKERWKVIIETLSRPINTFEEFESAVNSYNSNLPKFDALQYFLCEEMDREESVNFFAHLLPKIIALALRLPELLPCGIPLLKQNHNRSLSMSQLQISSLLANAFLCTFPWKKNTAMSYPGVNFVSLFSAFQRPKRKQCVCEKLKSICNYFRRVTQNVPVGVITFERKMIPRANMPRWDNLETNLGNTKIHITSEGTIEDNGLGFLQVDFANRNIGGGVLRYGCVQEEIRFVICPELIVSRLFVEQLGNGEAVIIIGAERYNNYTGYGDSFEWVGDHEDPTPYDPYGRRKTTICVIDATHFNKSKDQFHSALMLRELNKAYVGFSSRENTNLAPVATGNWGCGAFQGSKQLKTLIQLMACSASGRDLVYFSFGDDELMDSFYNLHLFLGQNKITIVQLWRFLCQFGIRNLEENRLYSFIQQAYFDSKKQPTISDFFNTSRKKPKLQTVKSSQEVSSMEVDETPSQSSSASSEDVIASSQPESPKKRVYVRLPTQAQKTKSHNIEDKLPKIDIGQIFDMLDGNGNQSDMAVEEKTISKPKNVFEIIDQYVPVKKADIEEPPLEEVVVVDELQTKHETLSQSKKRITDYFSKVD